MPVTKLSVALDEHVAKEAAEAAAAAGTSMSAWLNEAAVDALAIRRGLKAMTQWEADNGAFTPEEIAHANSVLDRLVGPVDQ